LHDLVVHNGDSLAEELWSEVNFLNYVACVEPDFPERGLSLEAGALVEKSIVVDQTLGESVWVMGKRFDDFERVLSGCRGPGSPGRFRLKSLRNRGD
jgi:hypothetical protein